MKQSMNYFVSIDAHKLKLWKRLLERNTPNKTYPREPEKGVPTATEKGKFVMKHEVTYTTFNPSEKTLQEYFMNEEFKACGRRRPIIAVEEIKQRQINRPFSNEDIGQSSVIWRKGLQHQYFYCFKMEIKVLKNLSSPHIPKLLLYNEKALVETHLGTKRYNFIRDSVSNNDIGKFAGALEYMHNDVLRLLANSPSIDLTCFFKNILLNASQTNECINGESLFIGIMTSSYGQKMYWTFGPLMVNHLFAKKSTKKQMT
ncbi:5417_t:CDS:2 [Cetraspora pellucida]|uniref:5417_t:CDS:1 n=1 Tax=Cetraspora pellucida TaxID=1433469 RepID=A0A9N8W4I3_9GLOM|nr:5417_t:CDS:2 [Cetraspora pellucida]